MTVIIKVAISTSIKDTDAITLTTMKTAIRTENILMIQREDEDIVARIQRKSIIGLDVMVQALQSHAHQRLMAKIHLQDKFQTSVKRFKRTKP